MTGSDTHTSTLDAEELFYLAIKASENSQFDKAIQFLKQSINYKPSGNSYFLLASQYAEIGMHERAIEAMNHAISLAPELWIAHFQLGMLYLSLNQYESAIEAWESLNTLHSEHPLQHFKNGLSALINDDFDTAEELIRKGIEENNENPSLNRSMLSIMQAFTQPKTPNKDTAGAEAVETNNQGSSSVNSFFLSKYDKKL